jgi:hypothetical protein
MQLSDRRPFTRLEIDFVSPLPGIYIIYDLAGPIYVGRSSIDIRRRLRAHYNMEGNRNIAAARRVGATTSLTFAFCCMPVAIQRDVEAILIRHLSVTSFANLRREAAAEDWPIEWTRLATNAG